MNAAIQESRRVIKLQTRLLAMSVENVRSGATGTNRIVEDVADLDTSANTVHRNGTRMHLD